MEPFNTTTVMGVVERIKRPALFLLNTFFPTVQTFDTLEVYFDTETDDLTIAPLVSPLVAGKVVESEISRATSIKPAYVKQLYRMRAGESLVRLPGEAAGGSLSPEARRRRVLARNAERGLLAVQRRKELMAAEYLRTGKVTITGEGYGTKVLDFGRLSTLTKTLAGVALWTDSASNPLAACETFSREAEDADDGAPLYDVVMEGTGKTAFLDRLKARGDEKLLDTTLRGSTDSANYSPRNEKFYKFAQFGPFNFWYYNDSYRDAAGVMQKFMGAGEVLFVGPIDGRQFHGAIEDDDAMDGTDGYYEGDVFMKSWKEKNPSATYLLAQSAPIVAGRRPNASLRAKVTP
jgi:hypothetical protein